MPPRHLSPEEAALWAQVSESVTPVRGRKSLRIDTTIMPRAIRHPISVRGFDAPETNVQHHGAVKRKPTIFPSNTLDANWDKRLARGMASPDFTIDLHEHSAAQAHARLEGGLALAVAHGARIVLLITGKARHDSALSHNPRLPPTTRGVIRASVQDWIAGSRWNAHIAAIRNAHPRHGGAGALYLILKRPRG